MTHSASVAAIPSMPGTDTAIFVMSFDGSEDLWKPFFTLFFKFWPDCPFPIYLQTNFRSYDDPRVTSLKLGKDTSFSDLLARGLAAVPHPYILMCLDDFFLTRPADTAGVLQLLDLMKSRNAAYLRLLPVPGPDTVEGAVGPYKFGRINPGTHFRTGLQLGLWRKSMLESLIAGPEGPRAFEMRSGERSWSRPDEFLSVTKDTPEGPVPYFCTAVVHGYWVAGAVKLCRQHGIDLDLKKRKLRPWHHRLASGNRFVGMIRKAQRRLSEWRRGVKVTSS